MDNDLVSSIVGTKDTTNTTNATNAIINGQEDNDDDNASSLVESIVSENKSIDLSNDASIVATDKVAYQATEEKLPYQDALYNHYSKTNPELFKGDKLDDIEGAIEKGIISEYSFVPTDDGQSAIKPHSSTTYKSTDGFPPTSYIYNQTNAAIEEQRASMLKKSIEEQMAGGFRVAKLWNEEDSKLNAPSQLPDSFGKYKDDKNKIVELPFMDGKLMEGFDITGLTEVTDDEGVHVVEDSLMKQVATLPVIGPALYSGMFELLDSLDYAPAAFKDIVETAGSVLYKNKTVWNSMNVALKAASNRSFANPKDMAEQLADGAGSFLEYLSSQGVASKVAGMGDDITRATGLYRKDFKGTKKEVQESLKLFKDYEKGVKQVKKQEKDAKWLANRLEKAINIERIKYATDVEIKEKVDAAKKIANENKSIRTELINSFEEVAGKTVSKVDGSGNKVIDYQAARTAGLEILKETTTPEAALKLAPRIDELTHPILQPDKLDGLVAVAKEMQKKNPEVFNNKKPVMDNLFDLIAGKNMDFAGIAASSKGDELVDVLNKYGLNYEEFILTVVGSGSQAAKLMNKLSQVKRARPLSETELLAQQAAEAADSVILNYAMRIENIRRGGLVSQLATASRNAFSGTIRAPLESLANIFDTAMYEMGKGNVIEGIGKLSPVSFVKPSRESLSPIRLSTSWKDSFANLKYIYDDPKASRELTDFILDRPELINQFDLLTNNLNEIQKVRGRGTGSTLDKIVSVGEDAVSVLNTPNRWQEYIIRKGTYLGELQRLLRNEYKIDMLDTLNKGKLKDLLNDSSTVKPSGARSFNELSADAAKRAMDVSYAKEPDTWIYKEISRLLTRSIIGTVLMPFPRFMFTSMELMGQYAAGASIPLTRKIMSLIVPPLRGPITAKDRQRISRNIVGVAAIGGFYQGYKFLSEDGKSPTDYKQLPVGNGATLDLSPLYPLRQYAYIAKAMEKANDGTLDDWFDAKEFAETFIGTNIRTGVGNGLVQDIIQGVTGGGDLSVMARTGKITGKILGNYLSTWAVPYAQLLEAQRVTGNRGTTYKDLAPEPTFSFGTNLMNEMRRPFDQRGFTDLSGKSEADAPKREFLFQDEKKRLSPATRVIFGFGLSTADNEDGEYLKELGYVDYKLGSNSESPKVRRFENAILREAIPAIVDVAQSLEKRLEKDYRKLSVGFKKSVSKEKYMQVNLKPLIDLQFSALKQQLKDGKIGAGGPYIKAMTDYKRLTKSNRAWATIEFIKQKGRPADASKMKDIQTLVLIGEKYGKTLRKALGSRK